MRFEVRETTSHARPKVFAAHRDQLEEIARHLEDVERVELRSRARHARGVEEQTHLWVGSPSALPVLIRPLVPPPLLQWKQKTLWDGLTWTATWEIDVLALGPAVEARGRNVYREEGGVCVIDVEGEFAFRPDRVPQLANVPASAVPMVEKAVVAMIVPMVKRSGAAVARFLDATAAATAPGSGSR